MNNYNRKPNGYKTLPIRQWAAEDRPCLKMLYRGTFSLSDAELLSIVIHSGTSQDNAVDLSRKILASAGNNLNELSRMSYYELTKFSGIGEAKATAILAALELGRRKTQSAALDQSRITSSNDVANYLRPLIGDAHHELVWCLFLNRRNMIRHACQIAEGGVTGVIVDVRRVLQLALEKHAVSIILAHNHPSGDSDPSEADRKITRQVKEAGSIMEIPLLDHLIITQTGYYSFADEGLL